MRFLSTRPFVPIAKKTLSRLNARFVAFQDIRISFLMVVLSAGTFQPPVHWAFVGGAMSAAKLANEAAKKKTCLFL